MSPKIVRNIKTLFHALTVASTTIGMIGGIGGIIPSKYALYIALASSVISGALNILTRLFPWLATEDESDDPPSEEVPDKVEPPVPAPPKADPYYPTTYAAASFAKGAGRKGDSVYRDANFFYLFPQFGSPFYTRAISEKNLIFVERV